MVWLSWLSILTVPWTAVAMEVYVRQHPGMDWPWWFILPAIWVNYGVFSTLQNAPSLLVGISFFSAMTLTGRLLASAAILHEPMAKGNAVAAILLIAAFFIGKFWR